VRHFAVALKITSTIVAWASANCRQPVWRRGLRATPSRGHRDRLALWGRQCVGLRRQSARRAV